MNYKHSSMYTEDGFAPNFIPKFTTPEKYIADRVAILNQLGIHPTEEDLEYLHRFSTEYSIDAAIKTVINKHWK